MQDKKKCTSNPLSSPKSDRGSTGSRNAFDPQFLRERRAREEEPLAAVEAESRGPWFVVEGRPPSPGGFEPGPRRRCWHVYRSWEDPETDAPTASFRFREQAFLYAAALEVGARGSVLTLGREPAEGGGYDVIQPSPGDESPGYVISPSGLGPTHLTAHRLKRLTSVSAGAGQETRDPAESRIESANGAQDWSRGLQP